MRDLQLARRQFFTGALFLAVTAVIAGTLLIPQAINYAYLGEQKKDLNNHIPAPLEKLPAISETNTKKWENQIEAPVKQISIQTQVDLVRIQGNPAQSESVEKLPATAKKVSIKITVYGARANLQNFVKTLIKRFPYSHIRSISIESPSDNNPPAKENPILKGLIETDLLVLLKD